MLLYDSAVSGNCYKVRLLLAQLSLSYERREVDVIERSNRLELLGELNPALRVPTLVLDDGRSLAESNAILWHFARGTSYLPDDPFDQTKCCSGCSSSSTATSRTSRCFASGSPSRS
jgi:glutathione S-transferase